MIIKKYLKLKGFTLIEILIAIFLFSIVATTIFGAYTQIFFSINNTENDALVYIMAKNCMDRILMDLSSIYVRDEWSWLNPEQRGEEDKPDPFRFIGENDGDFSSLRFTSKSHVPIHDESPEGSLAVIKYYVNEDEEKMVLRRCDEVDLVSGCMNSEEDPIIAEDISAFSLKYIYYDPYASEDNDEVDEEDYWDSDSKDFKYATPRAVEIVLKIPDHKSDDGSPIVFETRARLEIYRKKDPKVL